ncbi:NUDIX hydrolase [Hydrogenivirga sp. 128-5-R1-1]|uniref:NUDIX domain-containing protein n=1 Tax=Hydrogenivirga sp. 128-5-R1-1 TaxID=392423 RepID=UPI0002D8A0F0|nr:NUDIX hydrolase [Hydrogenivirga sp. 128-5-R1-1]
MSLRTPYLATDVIIRLWKGDSLRGIVLIERKNPPVGLALPGGFVEVGENVESAAVREMREETGLEVELSGLLGVYSDPRRDPRFHVVSVVFVGDAEGEPKAGSDAKEVRVFSLEDIPLDRLVFDHKRIILDFLRRA